MGKPEHVVNYMTFIAEEIREILAELGYSKIEDLVGRTDLLETNEWARTHWKASQLDLERIVYQPFGKARMNKTVQDHKIEQSLDIRSILPQVTEAIDTETPVSLDLQVSNMNRVIGTVVGSEVSLRKGAAGLPEDTLTLNCVGSAGQSVGAFLPRGMTLNLIGDGNDYVGKGLSGGKLILQTSPAAGFEAVSNVIAGNVAFYGATAGEAYLNGLAGERFGVRNSGATLVVEGVGDHGCEYMTGGRVVILGAVGKNFAAGMSGGVAYVLSDDHADFIRRANSELVLFETVEDEAEAEELKQLVARHADYTHSTRAVKLLENWEASVSRFIKVIPREYKQITAEINRQIRDGLSEEEAKMAVFMKTKEEPESVSVPN